ncbi:MAG: hypothetical protein JW953_12155, partial [Anaerolineae bacterium]|nr:hypothetical protein [Anaerolineae bacterium]
RRTAHLTALNARSLSLGYHFLANLLYEEGNGRPPVYSATIRRIPLERKIILLEVVSLLLFGLAGGDF